MPAQRLLTTLVLAAAATAGAARSEDAALLVGNSDYEIADDMANAFALTEPADLLRAQGVEVRVLRDADRAEIGAALRRFESGLGASDNALVGLSGRFVHSGSETWFLPVDASGVSVVDAALDAMPLSSVLDILGGRSGRSVLLLATMLDQNAGVGDLQQGIGPLDVPAGVTVIEAWPVAAGAVLEDTLAVPGQRLAPRLDRTDWASARGPLDARWSFLPGEGDGDVGTSAPRANGDAPSGERAFWERARSGDNEQSYIAYLDAYPRGAFTGEATRRLAELRDPNRAARIVEDNLDLGRPERREIQSDLVTLGHDTRGVDGLFGPGTRSAIGDWQAANGRARTGFLDRGMVQAIAAQAREEAQRTLEAEARYWRETGEGATEVGLVRFLERYPDGSYAPRARQRLSELRDAALTQDGLSRREEVLWNQALQSDTIAAYSDYARAFPRGRYADRARARIDALGGGADDAANGPARQSEEALNLNQLARRTIEERLSAEGFDPGTPDGVFDGNTRRAIRAYQDGVQLPSTGYLDETMIVRLLADTVRRALSR